MEQQTQHVTVHSGEECVWKKITAVAACSYFVLSVERQLLRTFPASPMLSEEEKKMHSGQQKRENQSTGILLEIFHII